VLRSMGALGLMREAIALHIESLRNHGEVVPKPQASAR
jgi:predicted RNase H-like HicB family nuclease